MLSKIRAAYKRIVTKRRKKAFLTSSKNTFELSADKVKKANKLGFTADEYVIYNLDKNDFREYLSEWDRQVFREQLGAKKYVFDNKILCTTMLSNFISVNTILAYKTKNSQLVVLENDVYDGIITTLKRLKKIVYKRISLGGGDGFRLLSFENDEFYINRQKADEKSIECLIEDTSDYLLEEYCVQNEFENSLFPHSVNTIRIITVMHKNGDIEPILSLQRIGADAGKCVDNACAGGLYSEIDVKTGELSFARSHGKELVNKDFSKHPVTNAQIEGVVIPNWQSILKTVLDLHRKIEFTGLGFVAWDVALVENGVKIIEANPSCSMDFAQTFHPERNGKIGEWMKEWGYIK